MHYSHENRTETFFYYSLILLVSLLGMYYVLYYITVITAQIN